MTSNVGASVIEKGGRSFGFFLRPDDEEAEQVGLFLAGFFGGKWKKQTDMAQGTVCFVCFCMLVVSARFEHPPTALGSGVLQRLSLFAHADFGAAHVC